MFGGFDYVTIDAVHRRVYAAHGGSRTLLIADSDTGKVVGQVRVGPMAGSAPDPATGHVFTGNGDNGTVSEVDPAEMKVLRSVDVAAPVDAIAYDPTLHRVYADEDNGTHVFVIDTTTMKLVKTITVPGNKPEYLAIDPNTHDVYQNIADLAEIVVIDPTTLAVKKTIPTPELTNNHPLQYDATYNQIVVGGTNGVFSTYSPDGKKLASTTLPSPAPRFDQCDLDPTQHVMACAGGGGITRLQLHKSAPPTLLDTTPVDPAVHGVAIDPFTHAVFTVFAKRDGSGDFFQKFTPNP